MHLKSFDRATELESLPESKGDQGRLTSVNHATDLADIHYVRESVAAGLGRAIFKAETFVAGEPFAVLLGDDLVYEDSTFLSQILRPASTKNVSVLALMEVQTAEFRNMG